VRGQPENLLLNLKISDFGLSAVPRQFRVCPLYLQQVLTQISAMWLLVNISAWLFTWVAYDVVQ
jgi:hypothetical protein